MVHSLGHRDRQPTGVVVQLDLRDPLAATPDVEVHNEHHVAEVGAQPAVRVAVSLEQLDQHRLLGAFSNSNSNSNSNSEVARCVACQASVQQGFLTIEEALSLQALRFAGHWSGASLS